MIFLLGNWWQQAQSAAFWDANFLLRPVCHVDTAAIVDRSVVDRVRELDVSAWDSPTPIELYVVTVTPRALMSLHWQFTQKSRSDLHADSAGVAYELSSLWMYRRFRREVDLKGPCSQSRYTQKHGCCSQLIDY
jgi:hypothetical protein